MPPTRIPTEADFATLSPRLTLSFAYPSPPESTTSILLVFHGLGDNHIPFTSFAKNLALPGVLAISIRGVNPLPPALLGLGPDDGPAQHFYWGDDIRLGSEGDGLEEDCGFEKATREVLGGLVKGVLVDKCGWGTEDILMFGYGQGGSLALGLASLVRGGLQEGLEGTGGGKVEEVKDEGDGERKGGRKFKGVVALGGGLLASMIPRVNGERGKSKTPVLVCCGRESEAVDRFAEDVLKEEFENVKVVRWKRADDGMPRSREEMLPVMEFFAERLGSGW